jgi:hypothetical protein
MVSPTARRNILLHHEIGNMRRFSENCRASCLSAAAAELASHPASCACCYLDNLESACHTVVQQHKPRQHADE